MSAGLSSPGLRHVVQADDLMLREAAHRTVNDLQLIVGLLALQSRRSDNAEVRQALADAATRVEALAQARSILHGGTVSLTTALRAVCAALHTQAYPRHITVSLDTSCDPFGLSPRDITTLALVVNELATNAIKHAFRDGTHGYVTVTLYEHDGRDITIVVDDDGLPFASTQVRTGVGMGIGLAKRLMASVGGLFIEPPPGSKAFELRMRHMDRRL